MFSACGKDELGRDLRDDRIAGGAQLSHAGGYPMSQREKAGASWPGFAVATGEPLAIVPRACLDNGLPSMRAARRSIISGEPISDRMSRAVGVAQEAICVSDDPLMFGVIVPPRSPSLAAGVVQLASIT